MSSLSTEGTGSGAATAQTRGAFILLEGVDRCGKTTQTKLLADAMNNAAANPAGTQSEPLALNAGAEATPGAVLMRFPDRTTAIGQMINSYLQSSTEMDDRAIHLLFSANRWEAKATIEATLNAGTSIVCDRYAYSGVAFSGAKPGLDVEWCCAPDRGLPAPDCVIYLHLPIEKAMERGEFGAERYEKEGFQRKVAENFKEIMAQDTTPWLVVDASRTIEEIHADITKLAEETKERVKNQEIADLWVDTPLKPQVMATEPAVQPAADEQS